MLGFRCQVSGARDQERQSQRSKVAGANGKKWMTEISHPGTCYFLHRFVIDLSVGSALLKVFSHEETEKTEAAGTPEILVSVSSLFPLLAPVQSAWKVNGQKVAVIVGRKVPVVQPMTGTSANSDENSKFR